MYTDMRSLKKQLSMGIKTLKNLKQATKPIAKNKRGHSSRSTS